MYNILIVDDEAEQCEALKIILERRKENIVTDICTTLEKAKIFCAGKKYDVLFLINIYRLSILLLFRKKFRRHCLIQGVSDTF